MSDLDKTLQRRAEERRDNRAMVSVYRKSTNETLDHFECAFDVAESRARAAKGGDPDIGYKITHVGTRIS
jgi:hypothetical protein